MSHSTHVGFRLPPAWAASVGVFRFDSLGALHSFALCAVGVGHMATAVCKLIPVLLLPSFAKSGPAALALGVGHIFALIASRKDPL